MLQWGANHFQVRNQMRLFSVCIHTEWNTLAYEVMVDDVFSLLFRAQRSILPGKVLPSALLVRQWQPQHVRRSNVYPTVTGWHYLLLWPVGQRHGRLCITCTQRWICRVRVCFYHVFDVRNSLLCFLMIMQCNAM